MHLGSRVQLDQVDPWDLPDLRDSLELQVLLELPVCQVLVELSEAWEPLDLLALLASPVQQELPVYRASLVLQVALEQLEQPEIKGCKAQ